MWSQIIVIIHVGHTFETKQKNKSEAATDEEEPIKTGTSSPDK